jgi:transcriptional regulator with XRE-family HTH domain
MDTLYTTMLHNAIGFITSDSNISCNMCNMTFVTFIDEELKKRGWRRADLARAAGVSDTALTLVYNGQRKPGVDLCQAIARALKIPPEIVYRHAGLLPNIKADSPEFEELKYWFDQMTDDEQELFLQQGRLMVDVRKNRPKGKRQQSDPQDGRTAHVMEQDGSH